jgi:hypothetical protein
MRRSYADTGRDADEAIKIISPTYNEVAEKKGITIKTNRRIKRNIK